jgi:hypothetical protein
MNDTPATKTSPSALDGFERAKPDEPIFTLQGGDPLGVEMTQLYIEKRRERALQLEDDKERRAELLRCTEAERTLWAMQEYLRGNHEDEAPEQSEQPDEPAAIDLHDYRVRAAQRISGMRCDLVEIRDELTERRGWAPIRGNWWSQATTLADLLASLGDKVEPRRLFKGRLDASRGPA